VFSPITHIPTTNTKSAPSREAVTQAAAIVGNLRNLALAERSAATDGLTCLPNKRWVHDTLRRIVAHSSHTSQRCPPSCAT
jgi:GGDEF domain-containing protein